eukprot:CAMPEP_0114567976 /NCGR_PEP_ID=MMETSP0114-20121206/15805_1 /TAXON_ID=31324 /ORGANISM="Goniomonas sp, Strain m" /LENGTH=86 /DNA_ID=CAMNT_0001754675 /DNA_START=60 /DNA_END=317 /DNA_ORIENTATION=-
MNARRTTGLPGRNAFTTALSGSARAADEILQRGPNDPWARKIAIASSSSAGVSGSRGWSCVGKRTHHLDPWLLPQRLFRRTMEAAY